MGSFINAWVLSTRGEHSAQIVGAGPQGRALPLDPLRVGKVEHFLCSGQPERQAVPDVTVSGARKLARNCH